MKYKIVKIKKKIKDPYGFIYITTNMINGKKYIGQKYFKRKNEWQEYLGSGKTIKKAILKYGRENFIRDIVAIAYSREELNKLEVEYINNHNAINSNDYYNIGKGGIGGNTFAGIDKKQMIEIKKKLCKRSAGENNPMSKKVICITTGEIFNYISEVEHKYNILHGNVCSCCLGRIKYCGRLIDGTPMQWMYYDDYLKCSKEDIQNKLNLHFKGVKNSISVICITTNEIFKSVKDAAIKYNIINSSHISDCCKGNQKFCGKLSNNTSLKWMYYDEYLKLQDIHLAS